ncbi:ATP-binding protein [bacterium]|nr:ATP-binding protein [bacterium]
MKRLAFRQAALLRLTLLAGTVFFVAYLIFETNLYTVTMVACISIITQIAGLMRYVEQSNRSLIRFLEAIKYDDFSQSFSGMALGSSFDDLKTAFNDVLYKFQQTRAEKEEHFRYLQIVVEHIGTGLLVFQSDGNVELINNAAKRLLRLPYLKNINELRPFSSNLVNTLLEAKSGDKALIKVQDHGEWLQLSINATEFVMRDTLFTLASIQNIQSELEEKEMEAWQNLIRVLTHEIMNSVTPISSLASTVAELLEDESLPPDPDHSFEDIRSAVKTIERRSDGLIYFVESYRKLTHLPKPNFKIFPITELFDQIDHLMTPQLDTEDIDFEMRIEPRTLELTADSQLIEQVLINLILNAKQALKEKRPRRIVLTSRIDTRGRVIIQISDNGPGILPEVQERIFIPFFTTKPTGSGIGLSLSRQIMRLHRGSIAVSSEPGKNTVFTLRF